jgi:hypothetical protein
MNKTENPVPQEIKDTYPKEGHLAFPNGDVENVEVDYGAFVEDHNEEREYWKGLELIKWNSGHRELRVRYWTRKRGTSPWKWGQFAPIISLSKLKVLLKMVEKGV